MSIFEELERAYSAAVDDLGEALDISSGLQELLVQVERLEDLEDVQKVLDTESGAAAMLEEVGLASTLPSSSEADVLDRPAEPGPDDSSEVPPGLWVSDGPSGIYVSGPGPQEANNLSATLEQFRRIDRIIEDLLRNLDSEGVQSRLLDRVRFHLAELADLVQLRRISREDSDRRLTGALGLVRQAAQEIISSGYAPRVRSIENEVKVLRSRVYRLFAPSGQAYFMPSDH